MTHSTETISYNQYVAFFAAHAREQIQKAITEGGFIYKVKPSEFMLNIDNMSASVYDYYLSYIDPNIRSQYLCNECRHFINRFGCLIVFNANEVREVVGWSMDQSEIPEHFKEAHQKMIELLMKSYIHSPFIVKDKKPVLGSVEKGGFSHLHILVPEVAHEQAVFCNTQNQFKNAGAVHDEFGAFCKKLVAINPESIIRAAGLINHEMVSKSESFKYEVMLLGTLRAVLTNPAGNSDIAERIKKSDAVWKTFIENYGFLNGFKSTAIGGLIDLIEKETPEEDIISQFNAWVAPDKYMRPTAEASDALIDEAEDFIIRNGYDKSLQRRNATMDDVSQYVEWRPIPQEEKETTFLGNLKDNKKQAQVTYVDDVDIVTYSQFKEIVLPMAEAIEIILPNIGNMGFVTEAVYKDAPRIFKHDKPENRNTLCYVIALNIPIKEWVTSATHNNCSKSETLVTVSAIFKMQIDDSDSWFWVLDGVRCKNDVVGHGIFQETLIPEFHKYRKVIEAYSRITPLHDVGGSSNRSIAGFCLSAQPTLIRLHVTVTLKGNIKKTYLIDRGI